MELYIAFKFSALCWVIITMIMELFSNQLVKLPNFIQRFICLKCITFWITLIFTQSIWIASISALINYIIENLTTTKL